MLDRTLTAPLAAALTAAALLTIAGARAPMARAGGYHVYACRTPAGEVAPADGWSGYKTGTYTYAENTCSTPGGALLAGLGYQAARTANTDSATWAFAAPAGSRLTAATLWRAGDAAGGAAVNAFYEYWIAGPRAANNPNNTFDTCVGGSTCEGFVGNPTEPMAASNRVVVPARNLESQLFVTAACEGQSGFKCRENQHDLNNFAAVVYVYAADVTLEQEAGPSVSAVGGGLASAATVSGTSDVTLTATDTGAGVYEVVVSVDGRVLQSTVPSEAGGRCRNVGETADGLPAFMYVQPCPHTASADVGVDTTRLADGAHHLVVSVLDAAGNAAPALDRTITVANGSPAATPGVVGGAPGAPGLGSAPAPAAGPGPGNGTNATAQATVAVAWRGARGPRLVSSYGRAQTALGLVAAPGGAPIAGAQVDVVETPSSAGARSTTVAVRTGADGRFSLRLPSTTSSRTLRFEYRAHLADALPAASAALRLAVRAGVTLTVTPRTAGVGQRIRFAGRLLGGPLPATGALVVLEARSPGGTWLKFDVARSDRRGRFQASYRFRFPGPARYEFRVLSEVEGDYPYAAGASPRVGVSER